MPTTALLPLRVNFMPQRNTFNRAAQHLPEDLKGALRRLWIEAGCMDLDYPSLAAYMSVVLQRFQEAKTELWKAQQAIDNAKHALEIDPNRTFQPTNLPRRPRR